MDTSLTRGNITPGIPTVIVVDDDPAIRHVLNDLLTDMPSYRVLLAGDSSEAVRVFEEEQQIDAIVAGLSFAAYDRPTIRGYEIEHVRF